MSPPEDLCRRPGTPRLSVSALGCLLGALCLLACATPSSFEEDRYENRLYGYRIAGDPRGILGSDWRLDNFRIDSSGAPTGLKKGETSSVYFDRNGDGDTELVGEHPSPDLRFASRKDDGVISVRTIPVSAEFRDKYLKVLMHQWVSSLSGRGELHLYDPERGIGATVSKDFTSSITDEAEGLLSGYEAYFARVKTSELARLEMDPSHVDRVIEVVLARTDYLWTAGGAGAFPVYILMAYENHPDYFDEGLPDFHALLRAVDLRTPAELPETIAQSCELGDRTVLASYGHSGQTMLWVRTLGLDEELERCVTESLLEYSVRPGSNKDRERTLVYHPRRQGTATRIPSLETEPARIAVDQGMR